MLVQLQTLAIADAQADHSRLMAVEIFESSDPLWPPKGVGVAVNSEGVVIRSDLRGSARRSAISVGLLLYASKWDHLAGETPLVGGTASVEPCGGGDLRRQCCG